MSQNVGNSLLLEKKFYISGCAVEMTIYVHWTCININRKDVHTLMISINGKNMNEEYGCMVLKNITVTMIFLKEVS